MNKREYINTLRKKQEEGKALEPLEIAYIHQYLEQKNRHEIIAKRLRYLLQYLPNEFEDFVSEEEWDFFEKFSDRINRVAIKDDEEIENRLKEKEKHTLNLKRDEDSAR